MRRVSALVVTVVFLFVAAYLDSAPRVLVDAKTPLLMKKAPRAAKAGLITYIRASRWGTVVRSARELPGTSMPALRACKGRVTKRGRTPREGT